jgi:hydroxypyruvate isomerase
MIRFSANLSTLFCEVDFLDRFGLAARAGFKAVECTFPYGWDKGRLVEELEAHGLKQVLHNLPPGDWKSGDRGIACVPGREGEFQESVGVALDYAKALNCPRLNCLAGMRPPDVAPDKAMVTLIENLRFAASALEKGGILLLVEALNTHDFPGFFLNRTTDVLDLLDSVDHPNLWIQYDVYHMQIMEGNLIQTIEKNMAKIAHVQIADVPGRHEPGTGEVNFENVFRAMDVAGYEGLIGCEYTPSWTTAQSLQWVKPYLGET